MEELKLTVILYIWLLSITGAQHSAKQRSVYYVDCLIIILYAKHLNSTCHLND